MTHHPTREAMSGQLGDADFARLLAAFADVVLRGDDDQIEAFLASHQESRGSLEQFLPTMRAMAVPRSEGDSQARSSSQADSAGVPSAHASSGLGPGMAVGDFRLVGEIGRGGMGIVYEAEQLSIPRKVALKVLPFAALAGERRLRRFQNEVRAAALLDHPHVVSVYSVGEERGIHYYAMQLVRGQSLASVIAQLRSEKSGLHAAQRHVRSTSAMNQDASAAANTASSDSTVCNAAMSTSGLSERDDFSRSVAQLGIQAADALQHAHEQGVIHRDIKPANLLLDATGKLRVTDFGLASIEDDANLTATGELVGTLRYMSPEQALGSRTAQDHRSDIFSLGATLYELLTLQPVVTGDHRADLLDQILNTMPRAPRQIDSRIPVDLETIVLKTLEKAPADRYQSAQELGDDLRRFVSGHTVRARRPSLSDRLAKWARRNVALVSVGTAITLALCVVLAVSMMLVARAKRNTQLALDGSRQHAAQVEDLLYAADLQLAYQAWDANRPHQAWDILNRYVPGPNQPDRRGYEWRLLEALTLQPTARVFGHHEGAANELAVFPGGERFASVGDDGQLRVWHVESGTLLKTIDTGEEPLHAVAISPDGATIATGGHRVQLWDAASGIRQMLLTEHDATVEAIAFSHDGERIATGSRYDEVRLFSRSGTLLNSIQEPGRHMTLEFSTVGDRLLLPCKSGALQVWQTDLSSVCHEISGGTSWASDYVTAAESGQFYVISNRVTRLETQVVVLHADTGRELLRFPPQADQAETVARSLDDRIVAVGFSDGSVSYATIGQNDAGEITMEGRVHGISAHLGPVKSIRFAHSHRLVTCGSDGAIKCWQLSVANNPRRIGKDTWNVALSPNDEVVASIQANERLQLHSVAGEMIREASTEDGWIRYNVLTYSHDGRLLATSHERRFELHLRDAVTCAILETFSFDDEFYAVEFSPASDTLAVITRAGSTVHFVDLPSRQVVASVPLGSDSSSQACLFTPDGRYLVCGGGDYGIVVLDGQSHAVVRATSVASAVSSVKLAPSQDVLVTGHEDGAIRLWDFPELRPHETLVGHEDTVLNLAIHPDGDVFASASSDGTMRLWSLKFGREWGVIDRSGSRDGYRDVEFSRDGTRLYAGRNQEPGLAVFSLAVDERANSSIGEIDWDFASVPHFMEDKLTDVGHDFAIGAHGALLVSDYELQRIDADRRVLVDVAFPGGQSWPLVAAAKDSPRVALADEQQVLVYDYHRGVEMASWRIDQHPLRIDISPDGRFVALARSNRGRELGLLDVNHPGSRTNIPAKSCLSIRFAPNGRNLIAGRSRQLLLLEAGVDGRWSVVRRMRQESDPIDVAFAPDGSTVASAGSDNAVWLFDARTGRLLRHSTPSKKTKLLGIDYSASGQVIATGGSEVRFWDAESLELWKAFPTSEPSGKIRFAREGYQLFARLGQVTLATLDVVPLAKPRDSFAVSAAQNGATLAVLGRPGGASPAIYGISADGQWVVGSSRKRDRNTAFCWTREHGVVQLPMPDGFDQSWAMCVGHDTDGRFIAGRLTNSFGTAIGLWRDVRQPPVIFPQPPQWRHLYVCAGVETEFAGYGETFGLRGMSAFIFDGDSVREQLGLRDGYQTSAGAVVHHGNVVLGNSWTGDRQVHSRQCRDLKIMRWVNGQPEFLPGIGLDASFNWRFADASKDGRVIVGTRWPAGGDGSDNGMAFRWEAGEVTLLGDLPGGAMQSYANGVSADGRVIVGRSISDEGRTAFVWDQRHGMRRLDAVLAQYGAKFQGWRLFEARAISADGTAIAAVGWGPGRRVTDGVVASLPNAAFDD